MKYSFKQLYDWAVAEAGPEQDNILQRYGELIVEKCSTICENTGENLQYSYEPDKAQVAENTAKICSKQINAWFAFESKR